MLLNDLLNKPVLKLNIYLCVFAVYIFYTYTATADINYLFEVCECNFIHSVNHTTRDIFYINSMHVV